MPDGKLAKSAPHGRLPPVKRVRLEKPGDAWSEREGPSIHSGKALDPIPDAGVVGEKALQSIGALVEINDPGLADAGGDGLSDWL